ncbi:MAG: ExbD/TolR family protein [Flavisolibacter sp.]
MVDLGFLLITFFIFTSMMGSPTSMNLVMPTDKGDDTEIPASGAVTLLIDGNGFRYFEGQLSEDGSNVVKTDLLSLRRRLQEKKAEVISRHVHDSRCTKYNNIGCEDRDLVVVIKPLEDATYVNIVAALDEMTISQVKRFVLVDVSEEEKRMLEPVR